MEAEAEAEADADPLPPAPTPKPLPIPEAISRLACGTGGRGEKNLSVRSIGGCPYKVTLVEGRVAAEIVATVGSDGRDGSIAISERGVGIGLPEECDEEEENEDEAMLVERGLCIV